MVVSAEIKNKDLDKTLFLIDGSAYIYRAYHAIRNLSNSKGLPTNAIFGFARILIKLIEDWAPKYVVMVFDAKGPTFRHDLYKDYKATRPPMPDDLQIQIPYIKEITKAFNLPVIEIQGYEADDVIGTLAHRAEDSGFSSVMVTGDKDFLQLVTDKSIIWDPMKDKVTDLNSFKEEFGLMPKQMIDVMGLSGDTSDNVPGVPGIGPKTALDLIKNFGSMKNLYDNIDSITKKKQHENLIQFKEQADLSKKLVEIDTNAPVDFEQDAFCYKKPDNQKLSALFQELEFRQLQQSFSGHSDLSEKKYSIIDDIKSLSELVERLKTADHFALDTETTSEKPLKAKLVGISVSLKAHEAFYIPLAHEYEGVPKQLGMDETIKTLKTVFENPDIKKIGQNIKYDWIVLRRHGIELAGVYSDTMVASYLINPSKRAHNLDQIALDFLGHKKITFEETVGKKKPESGFANVPLEKAVSYACEDADITLMAHEVLLPKLTEIGVKDLFENVEMPLIPVLMKMETNGICVDRNRLLELSKHFKQQLEDLEENIYSTAGMTFNIKSPQQLGEVLFEKLMLPVKKKTKKKTGYSTDVDVLTELAEKHELPALVLRHRTLSKLKSTYTDALLEIADPKTDRIHTSFNQTVTATGRLSSSNPNLQNIPIKTDEGREIRSAFVPQNGWSLISADYSQIELRLLAHCAEDEILIKAFLEDEDIHTRTAIEIFQIFPDFITPELRNQAKTINFSIIYGISAFSLAKDLGISHKMAQTYIDNYFAGYKGVSKFIEKTINDAHENKKTSTLLGRIRLLHDIDSSNKIVKAAAERIAVNTPIQGTAADLIKIAMINIDKAFTQKNLKSAMLLSVHDELVFEVPPEELDMVTELVRDIMENVWTLKVPLKVNISSGINWAKAH
ncbi:MAG: DNA polymerase I [Pseudomonadota bacterium]